MAVYIPTLQWTNQLSVDLRTVPRIPIRQCCFVRVNNEVVGGSVCEKRSVMKKVQYLERDDYPRALITRLIRLHPNNILTPPIAPLS